MPRDPPDDEEESENLWKGLLRDLLVAGLIVLVVLVGIYAYTGIWPPLVVVESPSMQHSGTESYIGVIDTGDMVFQQAAPTRADVITYLEGRASGYSTYGDYGDVIIFRRAFDPTPVIHRAIMYVTLHGDGTADVPNLPLLPSSEWQATNSTGPTTSPYSLRSVTIHEMGFQHNLGIGFDFSRFGFGVRSGYITMGDHNAYLACASSTDPCAGVPYDTQWLPVQQDIIGRARGEIPWFGLLKLTLQPTDTCCAAGWGDPEAPKNSWDSLAVSLVVLFALPFILEYAVRGWKKYVSPKLPEIRWPWRRTKAAVKNGQTRGNGSGSTSNPKHRSRKPPREESSGP
jgi:signal peptidase I